MPDVKITWGDPNYGESGHRVYRSTSTMDPQNLPAPIADLGAGVAEYTDTGRSDGVEYFYRVSAYFPDASEYVSEEFSITPQSAVYLLDNKTVPNAAYSVRRIAAAYTGPCMRVRRSSDNAEQDIGFNGEDLDTTALLNFCGGSNGYVTIWYDQSGNNKDVSFGTNTSQQPEIVNTGAVRNEGGKPAIWSRVTKGFATGVPGGTTKTMVVVCNLDRLDGASGSPARVLSGYDGSGSIDNEMLWDRFSGNLRFFDGGKNLTTAGGTGRKLFTAYRNTTEIGAAVNGGATTTVSSPNAIANPYGPHLFEDAVNDTNDETPKNYQEIVIYLSDETADLPYFRTNINAYYTIY